MLARIRAASTSRPAAQASARARTAPCAAMKSEGQTASSACQSPRPRWCACGIAASSVAACCGARVAAAIATIAATGLRLCGIAEEVPRPALARLGDFADLALRQQRQVAADLAERAAEHGDGAAERDPGVALRMPGAGRHRQAELLADPPRHRRPLVAERGERADGAAELQLQRRRARRRAAARGSAPAAPASRPPRGRSSPPRPTASACARASASRDGGGRARRSASISRSRSASIRTSASRVTSTIAVSITSWLVLPRWTKAAASGEAAATRSRSCCTSGIASAPARRASPRSTRCRRARRGRRRRSRPPRFRGTRPSAASASASAASNSSMATTICASAKVDSMSALASVRSNRVPVIAMDRGAAVIAGSSAAPPSRAGRALDPRRLAVDQVADVDDRDQVHLDQHQHAVAPELEHGVVGKGAQALLVDGVEAVDRDLFAVRQGRIRLHLLQHAEPAEPLAEGLGALGLVLVALEEVDRLAQRRRGHVVGLEQRLAGLLAEAAPGFVDQHVDAAGAGQRRGQERIAADVGRHVARVPAAAVEVQVLAVAEAEQRHRRHRRAAGAVAPRRSRRRRSGTRARHAETRSR